MSRAARDVLARLRRVGVVIDADGDRLHVDAPAGIVDDDARRTLTTLKPELLAALADEQRLLELPTSRFGTSDRALEVRVQGIDETLWFVPRVEHIALLGREGIARGRIWTAREMANLASIPTASSLEFRGVARMKAVFGAEIVEVRLESGPSGGGDDASA